jgi:hypothetical protein
MDRKMTKIHARPPLRSHARAAVALAITVLMLSVNGVLAGNSYAAESAQQFFGYSGGGTSLPASCDISKLLAQNEALEAQLTQVNNDEQAQLKQIQQETNALQPGDDAGNAALQAQQQQTLDSAKSKLADIKAQQEAIHQQTEGPSEQCKRDTVAQSISEMSGVESFASSSAPAILNKVDAEVANIEKLEPKLQSSGVNDKDMVTIKTAVNNVKSDSSTLRGFFSAMAAKSAAFVSQANADPIGTYNSMQGGGGPLSGLGSGAQTAAQNLVDSFTNLINLFDKLSGTGGQ